MRGLRRRHPPRAPRGPADHHPLRHLRGAPALTGPADALAAERAAVQRSLVALQADVEGIVAASEGANLDDEHDPEGATVAFERQRTAALLADARVRLAEVEAAEARLAAGTYGRCERCGGPIGAARLAARPATRFCVTCAS